MSKYKAGQGVRQKHKYSSESLRQTAVVLYVYRDGEGLFLKDAASGDESFILTHNRDIEILSGVNNGGKISLPKDIPQGIAVQGKSIEKANIGEASLNYLSKTGDLIALQPKNRDEKERLLLIRGHSFNVIKPASGDKYLAVEAAES